MKTVITENGAYDFNPGKYRITVKGGAGQRGEGEFGGPGGYGEVKTVETSGTLSVMVSFEKKASDGINGKPVTFIGETYHHGYRGGKAGFDASCVIICNSESEIVYAKGGGGGGAGSAVDYINYDPENQPNRRVVSNACNGGQNSDGILKYTCGAFVGGRGQDGDSNSTYDTRTEEFVSEYGYNKGRAEIIVEEI